MDFDAIMDVLVQLDGRAEASVAKNKCKHFTVVEMLDGGLMFATLNNSEKNQLAGVLFENVRPALKCVIYPLPHSLYTLILMPWRHMSLCSRGNFKKIIAVLNYSIQANKKVEIFSI